jgi:hypothetical protein
MTTFDDINNIYGIKYMCKSNLIKFNTHIGQRKLLLSEM